MGHGSSVQRSKTSPAVPATVQAAVKFRRGISNEEKGETSKLDLTVTGNNTGKPARYNMYTLAEICTSQNEPPPPPLLGTHVGIGIAMLSKCGMENR